MLKGLREHASAGFTTNTNMDTVVLDELLECSVCLEQLDQTSKVLPCQHTFCKRCLKELVESRKELRCPECRVLVDANVDDLPTNIFLVRILEGLKQQKQRKGSSDLDKDSTDQASPCARALYDYEPKEAGDLALHKGEIIGLLRQVDENWYEGYVGGLQGFLPANYVEIINPLPSLDDAFDRPIAKALYDFEDEQEQDLLTFKQGDVITVKRRVDENWCEGKLNNKLGIFPLTFVELNSVARNLVEAENGSDEARPSGSGISKPPRKFSSESKDGEPKRHTMHFVGQRSGEAHATGLQRHSLDISSTERLAEALDNVSARSASSSSRQETTPPSSRSSGSPSSDQWQVSPPRSLSGHSQGSPVESSTGGSRPASAEIGKEMYIALYSYKPLKEDELELSRGDSYYVTDKCKDGWFKGFSVTSQKRGVFPGNYVRLASLHNLLTRARSSSTDQEAPSTASSQNNNQPHQQRPPPRHAATEGGSRPRFHRSESTPSCNPRAAVLMESLVVNLDQGVITGVENRATGEGLAGRNRFVATSPLPPPPAPKSSSFWKKLKGKKKDKTRLQPPPPPPPPYQRCIPAGHAMLSPPPYDFGTLPSLPQQVVRQDSPASQLRTHQRVENPPVRERYRVIVAYPPQHEAELELRVGDVVYVTKKRQDGWYKGTLERNGKTGLFPGSFVGSF